MHAAALRAGDLLRGNRRRAPGRAGRGREPEHEQERQGERGSHGSSGSVDSCGVHTPGLCLTLEYDGTDFAGFQLQPNDRSVQGVLEAALAEVTRETRRAYPAGRTDAGVHARGQVVHVDSETRSAPPELQRALNAVLPRDVAVSRWLRSRPTSTRAETRSRRPTRIGS